MFQIGVSISGDVTVATPDRDVRSQCPLGSLPAAGTRFVSATITITNSNARSDDTPIVALVGEPGTTSPAGAPAVEYLDAPDPPSCTPTALQTIGPYPIGHSAYLHPLAAGDSHSWSGTVVIPPSTPTWKLVIAVGDNGADPNLPGAQIFAIDQ